MERPELFRARTFARDRRVWFHVLAVSAVLWAGTSAWLNRRVPLAARPAAEVEGPPGFVALAFDRVVERGDLRHLDRVVLRRHLRALATAGLEAVTLQDLRAAYERGAPLPARAIVLTFDEGYLSTYEAVDPVLRELHWPAVMFLRTDRQEQRDVSYLFWDRLGRMRESGLWEIASGDPPPVPGGAPANLEAEPPGDARISARLGPGVSGAWAPRGVDPLSSLGLGAAGQVALAARERPRWLGFRDDPVGSNRMDGNPYRIRRLRVDPAWTTPDLVARVERALAPAGRVEIDSVSVPRAVWVAGEGSVTPSEDGAELRGDPRADLWIPAAVWSQDWILEASVSHATGEFWVVQRDEAAEREWRFGGVDGRLFVQSRVAGAPPQVLAQLDTGSAFAGPHRLRIFRRGGGVWITWDGTPVASDPVTLPGRPHGAVGIVSYGPGSRVDVTGLAFGAWPPQIRPIPASPSGEEVGRLAREAPWIAGISPPWGTLEGGSFRSERFDVDLFRILARRFAWDVLPTIDVRDPEPPESTAWIAELSGVGEFAGFHLDLASVPASSRGAWLRQARDLERSLARSHRRLVVTP